jgi:hypothetical protein
MAFKTRAVRSQTATVFSASMYLPTGVLAAPAMTAARMDCSLDIFGFSPI